MTTKKTTRRKPPDIQKVEVVFVPNYKLKKKTHGKKKEKNSSRKA